MCYVAALHFSDWGFYTNHIKYLSNLIYYEKDFLPFISFVILFISFIFIFLIFIKTIHIQSLSALFLSPYCKITRMNMFMILEVYVSKDETVPSAWVEGSVQWQQQRLCHSLQSDSISEQFSRHTPPLPCSPSPSEGQKLSQSTPECNKTTKNIVLSCIF